MHEESHKKEIKPTFLYNLYILTIHDQQGDKVEKIQRLFFLLSKILDSSLVNKENSS